MSSSAPHRHYVNENVGVITTTQATHPGRIRARLVAAWREEGRYITNPMWLEGIGGELRFRIDELAAHLRELEGNPNSLTEEQAETIAHQILGLSSDLDADEV
jgi:hypothetical protein